MERETDRQTDRQTDRSSKRKRDQEKIVDMKEQRKGKTCAN